MTVKKWKTLESKEIFRSPFHRMRVDKCDMGDGKLMPNYYVIEFTDWVNIIPITVDKKIILVKQYRHANQEISLEFPGGTLHPGQNENPQHAAERELLEETGFKPEKVLYAGWAYPNPALQNNKFHTYVGLGCAKVAEQNLDPYENIEIVTLSFEETLKLTQTGGIDHSIMISAFFKALPLIQNALTSRS